MWNEPTIEEIKALQMPSIREVSRKRRDRRDVYLQFFNDEEDFFAAAFDPDSQRFFGYRATLVAYGTSCLGAWSRHPFSELVTKQSSTGAEFTRNLNFVPCRAYDVRKIRGCEEQVENYRA